MKRLYIIIIYFIFLPAIAYGQILTNIQKRQMNTELLNLLDKYEEYSSFSESHMQYGYLSLFRNPKASVYCDFIASEEFGKTISAEEYAANIADTTIIKTLYPPFLRNVRKSDYKFLDGVWHAYLSFDRTISYIDGFGIFFTGDYNLVLDCEYNFTENYFLISSISGKKNVGNELPNNAVIVRKTSNNDDFVSIDGEKLAFNEFNQAVTHRGNFSFNDDDVVLKAKEVKKAPKYSIYEFSYLPKKFRLRAYYDFAPFSAYKVDSQVEFSSVKSSGSEFGLEFGYMWRISKRARMGLGIGFGMSMSSLLLTKDNTNYTIVSSDYSKGSDTFSTFNRNYSLSHVTEGISFKDFAVPFYGSWEQSLGKVVAFSLDLGVKIHLNAKTEITPYSIEGSVSNTYVGQSVPFLSEKITTADGYLSPSSYKRNVYDVSAFVKGGFDIKLFRMVFFTLKVGYEKGFTPSFQSAGNSWCSETESIYPVVYSKGQNMKVRSFIDCISYSRQSIMFEAGIKFKL